MNYYSILNTPVIEYFSKKKLGTVQDVFMKENSAEIIGIAVASKGLHLFGRLFKPENILFAGINEISVMGPGEKYIFRPTESFAISFKKLIGLKTASYENNTLMGTVKDGYFDMEAGILTELSIGQGLADDLINGRKILSADSFKEENGILRAKNPELTSKERGLKIK